MYALSSARINMPPAFSGKWQGVYRVEKQSLYDLFHDQVHFTALIAALIR